MGRGGGAGIIALALAKTKSEPCHSRVAVDLRRFPPGGGKIEAELTRVSRGKYAQTRNVVQPARNETRVSTQPPLSRHPVT